jgi:Ni/Co efflux regulator RcnB
MKLAAATAAVLILAIPAAASAKPGHGNGDHGDHGRGHDKHEVMKYKHGKGHHASPVRYAGTPPGLAKKPYGMPPGQVKKWRRGERLPSQYYTQTRYYVTNPTVVHLSPPPAGYRWVRVDDNYYLAQTQTGMVSQIISALLQ